MFSNRFSIPVTLALASSLICIASAHEAKPLSKEIAAEDKLDTEFFKKSTMVQDILIATSSKVTDSTQLEAAYLFDRLMTDLKPEIAQRIRDQKVLCILVAHDELTSDVPQFKSEKTGKEQRGGAGQLCLFSSSRNISERRKQRRASSRASLSPMRATPSSLTSAR